MSAALAADLSDRADVQKAHEGHALRNHLFKLIKEPPFRILAKALLGVFPVSVTTRALWDISARPNYLAGLLLAAEQASVEGLTAFSAVEFGVAGGNGLLALQQEAAAVEKDTGVQIAVYGFDMGAGGLPEFVGDYRDHPDAWQPGDYPMDEVKLRSRLASTTKLILGNVKETVPAFVADGDAPPVGFVSIDVDLYSSTMDALQILTLPRKKMLRRTYMYFDDVDLPISHRFAGELLAIDDFNKQNALIKIDRLRGFAANRPFPEKEYLRMMYVAHDLDAINKAGAEGSRAPLMTHVMA